MHLILDGYCSNTKLLRDEEMLRRWLVETAEVNNLHSYGKPTVIDYPFPGKEGTALSGVLFLGESSITIHTYPEYNFLFLDIFHCLDFDYLKLINWVKQSFGISDAITFLLERGLDSNGEPKKTKVLLGSNFL